MALVLSLAMANVVFSQEVKRHNVSLNTVNLAFGTVQASYEYGFNENMSLALSIGQKFSSGMMRISGFDSPTLQTNDFNFKGIKFIPEYRWYIQKTEQNHTGFFIGAYYKFQHYKSPLRGIHTVPLTGELIPVDIDTNILTHTLGLQIGYKLPIYKGLFADFIIAGPGYSLNQLTLSKNHLEVPEFYQNIINDIREKYKDADFILTHSEIKKHGNGSHSAWFRLPAFRYGISIGYRF